MPCMAQFGCFPRNSGSRSRSWISTDSPRPRSPRSRDGPAVPCCLACTGDENGWLALSTERWGCVKRHDPEANAAAYLAGVTSTRARRRFEAHILECEKCWSEVNLGREGRGLAESARE